MVQKLDHSFKINIHIAQFHYSTLKLDVACTVAALSFKNGYTVKNESFLKAYSSHEWNSYGSFHSSNELREVKTWMISLDKAVRCLSECFTSFFSSYSFLYLIKHLSFSKFLAI